MQRAPGSLTHRTVQLQSHAAARLRRLVAALRADVEADRSRWVLWIPVAIGAGIAVYFGLPVEPPWWAGVVVMAAGIWLGAGGRRAPVVALPGVVVALGGLGVAAAQLRTHTVDAPVLASEHGPAV